MATRFLTALPVYNEVAHVGGVLDQVLRYSPERAGRRRRLDRRHRRVARRRTTSSTCGTNRIRATARRCAPRSNTALREKYDVLVTIDCDGQHEPQRIPEFVAASDAGEIVSGSRYLQIFGDQSAPPEDRRQINMQITEPKSTAGSACT